jgi:pyruvate dehydrogenase (quinone)
VTLYVESLGQRQDRIRFVQVRREETAALKACGYAKLTGRLGVCPATSGPGGIHLLNGLYDAKLDAAAVLAITGLQYHDLVHTRHSHMLFYAASRKRRSSFGRSSAS